MPPLFLEVLNVVSSMVSVVFDLIAAFCVDDFGYVVVNVCVMGSCIALFRVLRSAAGG